MERPSVFDHPLIAERYFFPRREAPRVTTPIAVRGAVLACASHRPHADAPLVVHFHGNGEVVDDYVPDVAEALAAVGLNSFFVEYRGYGASTGKPALVGMLDDVEAVLASLDTPPERTFVYGRSIGSIYAIEATKRRPSLGGLIIESGLADPLERVLLRVAPGEIGATLEQMQRESARMLDHEGKLSRYPGRVLVMHAAGDHMVDRTHAERNARWAPRSELLMFPRGDHNSILAENLPAIVSAVQRFAFAG
ncbi:MAG: alpha/beta hydrolase [Deltaproteobacteria bacterium]